MTQLLVRRAVDRFRNKLHASVSKEKLGTPWMIAAESADDRRVLCFKFVDPLRWIAATLSDRYEHFINGLTRIAERGTSAGHPAQILFEIRDPFAHEDRIGRTVFDLLILNRFIQKEDPVVVLVDGFVQVMVQACVIAERQIGWCDVGRAEEQPHSRFSDRGIFFVVNTN